MKRKQTSCSKNKHNSFHIYVKTVLSLKCCNSYSKVLLFWSEFLFYMTLPSLSHAKVTPEPVKMEVYANRQDFSRKKNDPLFPSNMKKSFNYLHSHINLQLMHNVINTVIKYVPFICLPTATFIQRNNQASSSSFKNIVYIAITS